MRSRSEGFPRAALAELVADVRPHFRNNIFNPSGFLIDRACRFHQVSRLARAPVADWPVQAGETCGPCNGVKYVMIDHKIEPCENVQLPSLEAMGMKEAERARKARLGPPEVLCRLTADDDLKYSIYKTFDSD